MYVRLLGPVEVWRGDQDLLCRCRPAERAVLAVLALRANQVVSRGQLIERLWGERHPPTAENLVQVHISRLRGALREGGEEYAGRIVTQASGYTLRVEPAELDLLEFERLAAAGDRALAGGDAATAARALSDALALWRGPALAGLPLSPSGLAEAARLEEGRLAALERRIEADIQCGRHAEIIGELRALVAAHPLRERLWAQLMVALRDTDRTAEALSVYTEVRDHLVTELGVEPGASLRRLQQELLASPPAPAARPVPRQLPSDVAGFTGRGDEMARLDALLAGVRDEGTTVVIASVSGTAGVGKTALATRWAHRVRDRFPDGSLFANLRGYDPSGVPAAPDDVLDAFLRALGVPPQGIPPTLAERAALFRTQLDRRRVLVVLDNAATSEQVRWLLPGTAGSLVVVTSRSRLSGLVAREGAHRVPVDLLSEVDALALLRRVLGAARVDAEPAAAAELVRLCAYLPLALRLAAERAGTRPQLTLADLAAGLADEYERLDLLAAGDDETTAVRAIFAWSYQALPPDAARAFRLLGLAPGPDVSLPAVAALTGTDTHRARRLLGTLTDVHLVHEASPRRFQLHDLLRVYAIERARQDEPDAERDAATRRILEWYLRTADAADRNLMPHRRHVPLDAPAPGGFATVPAAVAWCDAERVNLVAATHLAAELAHHDLAWKLPQALWSYFTLRKPWRDWISTHRAGLEATRRGGDRYGEAFMLTGLAQAYSEVGRTDEAFDTFDQALAVSRAIPEPWIEAAALTLLSITHRELRQFPEALERGHEALRGFTAIGDVWGRAWAYHNLGETQMWLRRHAEAADHAGQARALFASIDDRLGEGLSLSLLAQIHHSLGEYDAAAHHATLARTIARRIGNQHGEAIALYTLGKIHQDTGDLDAAVRAWRTALAIFEQLGAPQASNARARLVAVPRHIGVRGR